MKLINFSLSELITKSAKQLCYLRKDKTYDEPMVSHKFIQNDNFHKYFNMRGTYEYLHNDIQININYVLETLEVNNESALIIERKNVVDKVELWYKQYAVIQTAAYQAFVKLNKNKVLQTASFCIDRGEPAMKFDVKNRFIRSELHLGKRELYNVYVPEPEKLIQYYIAKAVASLSYTTAQEWDDRHKHKDFEFLHGAINYRSKYENKTA